MNAIQPISGIAAGDDNLELSRAKNRVDRPLSIWWMRLTPSMIVIFELYLIYLIYTNTWWALATAAIACSMQWRPGSAPPTRIGCSCSASAPARRQLRSSSSPRTMTDFGRGDFGAIRPFDQGFQGLKGGSWWLQSRGSGSILRNQIQTLPTMSNGTKSIFLPDLFT
jgi:hypothetical protein